MYEIRKYDIRDREGLIKLWIEVCVNEHGFEEWKEGMSILVENEYETILVALLQGEVIGSMAYKKINDEVVELKRVYVYSKHRGKGIAKKLYDNIIKIIKEKNYKKILVETWESFEKGIEFYYRNNFKLENKEDDKYIFSLDLD